MSNKPIFVATHPRACSTAFERVFMTRRDSLHCVHEPFGDAFYYGPERLSSRFEGDEEARTASGYAHSTFKTIMDRFESEGAEGKRLLIKDMIYYLLPPNGAPPSIAPSLARKERGVGTNEGYTDGVVGDDKGRPYPYPTNAEPGNPTVIPQAILEGFHFTFLIRHPRYSVPSYYRCTVPPLDKVTGFFEYMPSEAGYDELRRFFDYLRSIDQVGPRIATGGNAEKRTDGKEITNGITNGVTNGDHGIAAGVEICVVDADDLLDNPTGIVEAFCHSVGIHYDQEMLTWDTEKDHQQAKDAFEKWTGFHEDAIDSKDLKPRLHKKQPKSKETEDAEWREKFGDKGAEIIRATVDANIEDYEYLKQFALKV